MTFESEMLAARQTFVVECRDLLDEMEHLLLGIEDTDDPQENVNALFRAAHTVKGSAGLFGLDHIVRFAHVVEAVLERLRSGEIEVSTELIGVLLPCRDHLADLVYGAEVTEHATDEQEATTDALLARLAPFVDENGGAGSGANAAEAAADGAASGERDVHLSLRFGADTLRDGMDPLSFVNYLATLGTVQRVRVIDDLLPEADAVDPERCYLAFQVQVRTAEPIERVEEVFEFVADDGDIRVLNPGTPAGAWQDLIDSFGDAGPAVAEILREFGAFDDAAVLDAATAIADAVSGVPEPATPAAPASKAASTTADAARPAPSGQGDKAASGQGDKAARDGRNIRVDASRLDRLIDLVGELVVAGAAASVRAERTRDGSLLEAVDDMMRLVEEVRDSAMQLRMVPIGTTFARFQRVVRDVSTSLGKDISLVITGGETEVDKALVERIGDPLTHLVRNAVDHGIESQEQRLAAGKPARGTLRLNAYHESGSIVIEVSDDGGGIDRDRVFAKAVERGLVDESASLTDSEVYDLIFEPGFSTAPQVTDLSGRGVGMDVVKRNVKALRGTIEVDSRRGEGSTLRIRLPLTLAIIDGFLVGVHGSSFVIPLEQVVECVELPSGVPDRNCMDLRGEVLPFVRLGSAFALGGDKPKRENVVVVESAGTKIGLVVDSLMGEFQTVIKPLGPLFEHVRGVGGSTILGTGDVALIIDVPGLVHRFGDRERARQFEAVAAHA
ncbi:chemotaxis protein CheA [Mangrovihabitans endophyticus]|uniref:Chemotaxis protein CheA n=1 Tax=Mangrovihabitans endophyticus TaxID=1751298 RepID=A0A8J3C2A6_9ACTN|nr:chemotaxis protein CheA [Mangrovihabitans endophyticus]GGL07488.1 chemotaxis protein CheA [Mangrovihabitans endophyticus]